MIQDVIENIPEQLSSAILTPWLSKDFIPFVIKNTPEALVSRIYIYISDIQYLSFNWENELDITCIIIINKKIDQ